MTTRELREMLGLPPNTKPKRILNHAVRRTPGGSELLRRLEALDYQRIQSPENPHFAAEVGKLLQQRDRIIADIRAGRVKLSPVEIPQDDTGE